MKKLLRMENRPYLIAGALAVLALLAVILNTGGDRKPPGDTGFKPPVEAYQPEGDVAAFWRACVDGVLKGGVAPAPCRSFEAAREAYGVDARFLLELELGRMIMTARRIARGELMTENDLKACRRSGACVEIPMIPPKFHDNEKLQNSTQGIRTRAAFWHLVNDGNLTQEACSFMDICKAYYRLGLVQFDEQGNEIR